MNGGMRLDSYQIELGRWFTPVVFALTGFRQLPVMNAALGLVAYVSSGFAVGFLIESCLGKRLVPSGYMGSGLLCALIPFANWTFYYSWMAAVGPLAQLICVVGLILISSAESFYDNRFASFSCSYIYVVFTGIGFLSLSHWMKFLHRAGAALAIWISIVQAFLWQDAHVKQNHFDERVLNRVIARIEMVPGFSYDKTYSLLQVGSIPNMRSVQFAYHGKSSPYQTFNMQPPWAVENSYVGLEPRFKIEKSFRLRNLKKISKSELDSVTTELLAHVERVRPWPHESSVTIVGDTIVVVLNHEATTQADSHSQKGRKH
jgi:hypothetical protein